MERVQLASIHSMRGFVEMSGESLGGLQFCTEPPADWLVVFDDIVPGFQTLVPASRRIAVITEPPGFKTYWPKFLDQFGIVLTPFETTKVSGTRIISHLMH